MGMITHAEESTWEKPPEPYEPYSAGSEEDSSEEESEAEEDESDEEGETEIKASRVVESGQTTYAKSNGVHVSTPTTVAKDEAYTKDGAKKDGEMQWVQGRFQQPDRISQLLRTRDKSIRFEGKPGYSCFKIHAKHPTLRVRQRK